MSPARLPPVAPGEAVGLFGGSFDPAHEGHLHLCLEMQRRCGLSQVWWIVARGNPLKCGSSPFEQRLASARARAGARPGWHVLALERELGLTYAADTAAAAARLAPRACLIWIMGADSFAELHLWRDWRRFVRTLPIAVAARPNHSLAALVSPAATLLREARRPLRALPDARAPAWGMAPMPHHPASSTRLRAAGAAAP